MAIISIDEAERLTCCGTFPSLPLEQMAMGRKDVLRYSVMSLCRKGGNVANVEIMVYGNVLSISSLRNGNRQAVV